MARDLAIDLGTANTLVYMQGRGIVINEPSVIAVNRKTGEVLATGQEAWGMIGRTPGYIVAVRPLRGGAITDIEITEKMIRLLLQRAGVSRFSRPKVLICVPSAITEVERRAVTDATRRAGAADAQLLEQPMAAAIGADLPINEPVGNMVIDIGGGTTETAVISLGGIVALEAIRVEVLILMPRFKVTFVANTVLQLVNEPLKKSKSVSVAQWQRPKIAMQKCAVAIW